MKINYNHSPKGPIKNLSGLVIPADWDEDGNVIAVAISTAAENINLREHGIAKGELLRLVHKETELTGFEDDETTGTKIFFVSSYRFKKKRKAPTIL